MKDTLLNYLKTLKIVPQKRKDGSYLITYAPRAWEKGFVEISPKSSAEEIDEAIKWLDDNQLALSIGGRNSDIPIDHLVKL